MRRVFTVSLTVLFLHLSASAAVDSPAGMTAFVGATVIDGTDRSPRPDAVVLVAGERIAAVGNREEVTIPKGARVIDAQGKWIIPGLIDAHVHFFQSGGLYTRPDVIDLREFRPYKKEIDWIKAHLLNTFARYLASGVTSVVDMGGPFWNFKVRELARRTEVAPRMAMAGPLISTYLPPELRIEDPPIIKVNSPEAARALVRQELTYKPDLIKIWFIPSLDQDLVVQTTWVQAAIAESHTAGLRVVVHATQLEVARAAVRAGADILAHSVDDRRLDEAFIQLLKDRKVVYVTTLMVHEGYQEVLEQQIKLTEIEQRFGDPEVIATFDDLAELPFWKRPFWIRWHWPDRRVMFSNLKRLQESGITIAAGTDAGNIGTLHGPALHREFELMAEAGLTPQEILTAATRGGARVMGREAGLGTLEAGKLADLVLLDADPLAAITNVQRIYRVVKGGLILDPQALIKGQ